MENGIMETSAGLPEEQRDIETITSEILYLKNKAGEAILEIGRRLNEAKEQLSHGEWLPWLEERVGFSVVTAQRFMRLANEWSNASPVTYLGVSKALQLLALPPAERDEFLAEKHDVNGEEKTAFEMTRKELQEAIRARKDAEEDKEAAEIEKEHAERELEAIKREYQIALSGIEDLKAEIEALKNAPKEVTAVETVPDKEKEAELEAKISALEEKLAKAKEKEKEAKAKLEVAESAGKDELEKEKAAREDLQQEVEALKKKLQVSASPVLSEFKLYFGQAQEAVRQMQGCIIALSGEDPDSAAKLRAAARALLEKSREAFNE